MAVEVKAGEGKVFVGQHAVTEPAQGRILKIQDERIYFNYKGGEGRGADHYISIENDNWPGLLPYSVFADVPGDNASRYPAFGGNAVVDPEMMTVTGLSPELEDKETQTEIMAVFQEYVNSHPEIGKAWEETKNSAREAGRVHFHGSELQLDYYADVVSLGKKDNKEEFLFRVVCAEDFAYGAASRVGEKCTVDLNTDEVTFSGDMAIDDMGSHIMSAVQESINQYHQEGGTKDHSVSFEYFNLPERTPLDTLQKVVEEHVPEEIPVLEEIRRYMAEMDGNYKSMYGELQSLKAQLAERSDAAEQGIVKKTVENLEKDTKSFREHLDGFKKPQGSGESERTCFRHAGLRQDLFRKARDTGHVPEDIGRPPHH
ncbi:MAG: hypothetical protein NC337_05515 [Roseburia sp.]|nr:hypothetical protein [Roseburia sp.]